MKLQIDTTLKTIKIEEPINLGDFIDMLNKLFPNNLWKEFKLLTEVIVNWNSPITIQPYIVPNLPYIPYSPTVPYPNFPWVTYCDNNSESTFKLTNSGVYNVEL